MIKRACPPFIKKFLEMLRNPVDSCGIREKMVRYTEYVWEEYAFGHMHLREATSQTLCLHENLRNSQSVFRMVYREVYLVSHRKELRYR